ncbi:hypothetical protein C8J56DRAFT_848140 [Mycena floridula]|nr:hypothetical protein C8J56DRAFT_848140 [Mycena floridula]
MTRFTIIQGAIEVSYGLDDITGYFLSVVDTRLSWDDSATTPVVKKSNEIREKIAADGGGSYFELQTGRMGLGHQVDREVIAGFMKQYGVPEAHVTLVKAGKELPEA